MPAIETPQSRRTFIGAGFADGILGALPTQSRTGSPVVKTTIRVEDAVTTLVNVFTLEPDNQPKALVLLQEGSESMFSKMPGWISTSLLKSKDGRQVVVYSQWRDEKDIDAFRQDPRMKPYFQRFGAFAKHEAFTCEVSYSLHA
jgi:heme-degrading monooxygenase HmoA